MEEGAEVSHSCSERERERWQRGREREGERSADGASHVSSGSGTESGRLMEEQQAHEEVRLAQSAGGQSEDASTPAHQTAPTYGSDSSTPLVDTPASPGPGDHGSAGEDGDGDAQKEPGGEDRLTDDGSLLARPDLTVPLGVDPLMEEGCGPRSDAEQAGAGPVTIRPGDDQGDGPDTGQVSAAGEDSDLLQAEGLEVGEGEEGEEKEDIPEEDFEDEFGDETVVVAGMAVASLDEMAKRIKVEQVRASFLFLRLSASGPCVCKNNNE